MRCVSRLGPIRPTRQASVHFLGGGWLIHLIFAGPSRLLAIHLNNKALALMENENNTKLIHYLDGGDVCGFIVGSVVGGGSGRVHLIEWSTEILPLLGRHLPARLHKSISPCAILTPNQNWQDWQKKSMSHILCNSSSSSNLSHNVGNLLSSKLNRVVVSFLKLKPQ